MVERSSARRWIDNLDQEMNGLNLGSKNVSFKKELMNNSKLLQGDKVGSGTPKLNTSSNGRRSFETLISSGRNRKKHSSSTLKASTI